MVLRSLWCGPATISAPAWARASSLPILSAEVTGVSVTRMLEVIRTTNSKTRFYQPSTSERFGQIQKAVQSERAIFSSPQPLWGRQALQPLDYSELTGEFWPARLQRHPLQPRVSAAWHRVRHSQDHSGLGAYPSRSAGGAEALQPGQQARLRLRQRLCARHVADATACRTERFRHRPGLDGAGVCRKATVYAGFDLEWKGPGKNTQGKANQHLGWKPEVQFDVLVRMMAAADLRRAAKEAVE